MKLANQLAQLESDEIARAIRVLLATPLVTVDRDAESFDLIRRRQQPLKLWFDYVVGWRLAVEPRAGYARLTKVRPDPPAAPARRGRGGRRPFNRRRYTLLCVVAAELLATPVTTIGLLADRVVQATAADDQLVAFDTASRGERSAFVDALAFLEEYGVIVPTDGTTETYLEQANAKVLYLVDPTRIHRLLAAPVAPSRVRTDVEGAEAAPWGTDQRAILTEARYGFADGDAHPTETQRNLWLRHSIMRRLLDDPVVYRAALSHEEIGYLASPTGRRIVREAVVRAGFDLEERAEGYLLVDAEAVATDDRFPDDRSTAKVAALILLDHLVMAPAGVPRGHLVTRAQELLNRDPGWARAYQSSDGARRMAEDAVGVLLEHGLAAVGPDTETGSSHAASGQTPAAGPRVLALPAAHRYAVRNLLTVPGPTPTATNRGASR